MKPKPIEDVFTELCDGHWKHNYNWNGIDPETVANRHHCSAVYVQRVMLEIEKTHPKPKQSNALTCKHCGANVIRMGDHLCDPTVFRGIGADGSIQNIRFPHANTCPDQYQGNSGADAAAGGE